MKQKNTAPAFQKNQRVELEITGLTAEGAGVGRAQEGGMAVFVPGVIPGERVLAHIVKPAKTFAWGKALEILRPSPDRVPPDCPHAGPCGGCVYRHMAYSDSELAEQQKVQDALSRIGGFVDFSVDAIVGAQAPDRYRNKAQFPIGKGPDGKPSWAFTPPEPPDYPL